MTDLLVTNVLQRLYRELGVLNTSKATGGSTTTVIDTTMKGKVSGDPFKDGVLFASRTTDGLAPQGQFQRISKYESSSQTFTVDTAFTAAFGAGDVYSYADLSYPNLVMIDLLNDALTGLGMIDLVDDATLTTAADQTEYTAAVAWKRSRPRLIEYYDNPDDSNDRRPKQITDFDWVPAAAGSTGLIILRAQPPTGVPLRVWYQDLHPTVTLWNDKINETVPVEVLAMKLLEKALNYQNKLNSGQDEFLTASLMDARNEYDRAEARHPRWRTPKRTKTIDPKFSSYQ